MELEAQRRELEWTKKVNEMELELDWQRVRDIEGNGPLPGSRSRSSSRVRDNLYGAVALAAAHDDLNGGTRQSSKVLRKQQGNIGGKSRPASAGAIQSRQKLNWDEAEAAIDRLVDHTVPGPAALGLGF